MCLIAIAYKTLNLGPLVLLANRDEFYTRPSAPLDWWEDHPDVLGGRDLKAGGSWLAVRRNGRFAALTNVRQGVPNPRARSRGELVQRFVCGDMTILDFADTLRQESVHYAPFNLLFGQITDLCHFHSPTGQLTRLTPGVHTLSNATLDTPWFKCERIAGHLRAVRRHPTPAEAFLWLGDATPAPLNQLPNTGVGLALEKMLSPILICGRDYGTVGSTLLSLGGNGEVMACEQGWGLGGRPLATRRFSFRPEL